MVRRLVLKMVGVSLLSACLQGQPPAQDSGQGPSGKLLDEPAAKLTISLQVTVNSTSYLGTRYLRPRDTVHTGDRMAFQISVNKPSYVYVVNYSPTGWSQPLFPARQEAETPLPSDASLRIPEGTAAFELPGEPDEEQLLIAASATRMDVELATLLRLDWPPAWRTQHPTRGPQTSTASPRPAKPPPPPPPPPPPKDGKSSTERDAAVIVTSGSVSTIKAVGDRSDRTLLWFPFRHDP